MMGTQKSKKHSLNFFSVPKFSQPKLTAILLCIVLFLITPSKAIYDACGGILESWNGTITSPSFPGVYPKNTRCVWDIKAPNNQRRFPMTLNFTHLQVESSDQNNCRYDSVNVSQIDLDNAKKPNYYGPYCGSGLPLITFETNHIRIQFKSDGSNEYTGFAANYFFERPSCDSLLYFQCNDTLQCISLSYKCDGIIDCRDMSDEQNCTENVSGNNETENIKPQPLCDLHSYAKFQTDPINQTNLEFLIDYKEGEKEILAKHRDFDSEKIMRALIVRAASTATPPNQFYWEIRQLLSAESDSEQTYFEELQEKYKIRPKAKDQDSATLFRLRMMFPHYCNLGQKPFFNSSRINVVGHFEAPAMLQYAEFAGLIPRSDGALKTEYPYSYDSKPTKQTLIALHLYLLSRNSEETVPHRIRCLTLKERMEKSVLSDDRRIRLLQNNHILTASKRVGDSFLCMAPLTVNQGHADIYSCIPKEFHNGCTPYL